MILSKKHIAIEILPRALWIVMAVWLYLGQHLTDSPPVLRSNVLFLCPGVLLAVGGFLFWMYVGYYMKRALFDKSLVTDGPFWYVRHPMYVGIYVMLAGIGILFFSKMWFLIMLAFVPVWYLDCRIEERQMSELHGEKYRDYKKRAGMFFPKITRGGKK